MKKVDVTVLPLLKKIKAVKGARLLDALKAAGMESDSACGGRGVCGKCEVLLVNKQKGARKVTRKVLACQFKVESPCAVQLRYSPGREVKVLKEHKTNSKFKADALVKRKHFTSGVSLVLDDGELLGFEKHKRKHIFGLAIDVGTTTVCVSLCNLERQEEVAQEAVLNAQARYGADIITRLDFALKSRKNQLLLYREAVASINRAIGECVQKSGVHRDQIYTAVVVGNSVMHHLLLKLSLHTFVTPPYQIRHKGALAVKAKTLDLDINPNANVRFLPLIEGFVGSDVLATIISLRLFKNKHFNLCVDLGTNGEIIIGSKQGIEVASCAAGPAFEGYNVSCGMIAKVGAIEWVSMENGCLRLLTIGHIQPQGICGSGIIDILSELLKAGIVDSSGQMKGEEFTVYKDKLVKIDFTARDVRSVQLAKAAVCAGAQILMKKVKANAGKIKNVFLAGALGNYLNAENALRIGLLPKELKGKIKFVGNTAFLGAKQVLFSANDFRQAVKISKKIKHVALAKEKGFSEMFAQALSFPKK
ncbi:MAG: ASKHA domain-containing protein [Candidatus Omnitrophota bacterium]